MAKRNIVSVKKIDRSILFLRDKRVMLDADLAFIYGTTTKRINEQVKRNINRFPRGFVFQLTDKEKDWVVTNCDHLKLLRFSPVNPYAFTEHGTVMVATILNTAIAAKATVEIVKGFVKFKKAQFQDNELEQRINEMEAKYDRQFKVVFQAFRKMMNLPNKDTDRRRIGYRRSDEKD